jgi:hypothetical protein
MKTTSLIPDSNVGSTHMPNNCRPTKCEKLGVCQMLRCNDCPYKKVDLTKAKRHNPHIKPTR